MGLRERRSELLVGALFLAAGSALWIAGPASTPWDWARAVVLVFAYAGVSRVRFEVGVGVAYPTVLVLVPMLFLLPAHAVPLVVAAGYGLGYLPDVLRRQVHPTRALNVLGDSWHAIGPALVLSLAVDGGPRWEDWPWYVAALAAQFLCDTIASVGREWMTRGVRPQLQLRVLGEVYLLDAVLAPVGLLAAFATEEAPYAFLLGAPLLAVFSGYAQEREHRLTAALDLSESRTRLLESELQAARAREEVLGAVSHELQTPLAVVLGLASTLRDRGGQMAPERVAEVHAGLLAAATELRHQVRQTLDYQKLQAGHRLPVGERTIDVSEVTRQVCAVFAGPEVVVNVAEHVSLVRTDADRVHQVLASLLQHARETAPDGDVEVLVGGEDGEVRATVRHTGPEVPEARRATLFDAPHPGDPGNGIALYVAAAVAESMGATLTADFPEGGGTALTLVLPVDGVGLSTSAAGRASARPRS